MVPTGIPIAIRYIIPFSCFDILFYYSKVNTRKEIVTVDFNRKTVPIGTY